MASEDIVRQETLGILKKKRVEDRFCVLYKDRLDYFTSEEAAKSEQPRGRLALKEVDSIQDNEDGFTLKLTSGQSLALKTSEESKQQWLASLEPLLKVNKAVHSGYLNVERKGKVISPFFALQVDSLERHESKEDFESGKDPRGTQPFAEIERLTARGNRFMIGVKNQTKPLELFVDNQEEFAAWTRAFEDLLKKQLGANFVGGLTPILSSDGGHVSASVSGGTTPRDGVRVLCEGDLLIQKKSKEERRYCILRTDVFEYFLSETEFRAGAAARCRALMEDITAFEVTGELMKVTLGERTLELKALSPEDLRRWTKAWETDPDAPEAQDLSNARPVPATPSMSSPKELPPRKGKLVCHGRFHFRKSEDPEARAVVFALREGCVEIFMDAGADVNEGVPADRIMIEEIQDLEVEDDRFKVRLADNTKFELLSPEGRSIDDWYDELKTVFEEADSANQSVAGSVKDVGDHAEVAELAKSLFKSAKTVNAMLKTDRRVNQQEVKSAQDFFEALKQEGTEELRAATLVEALKKLDLNLTREQIENFALAMDGYGSFSGGITLPNFEKVLKLEEKEFMPLAEEVLEKRRPLQELKSTVRFEPIEVNRNGFISGEGFEKFQNELATKAEPSFARQPPGEMEDDLPGDLLEPSSPSRPARNRAICSGAVEVNGQKRHGVLYPDRLAFFENPEDIVYADPTKSVQVREMQTVKVTSTNSTFEIQDANSSGPLKVKVVQAFETWQSCLAEVLAPTFSKEGRGKTVLWKNMRSPTDTPVRLPKRGIDKPMHHGPLKVVTADGSEETRYFLVYVDRFERFPDAASAFREEEGGVVVMAMDVKAVRVVDKAFIFELRSGNLELRVPEGEDMEIWVATFQLLFHPGNEASQTPSNVDGDARQFINRRSPFLKDGSHAVERGKFDHSQVASEVNDEQFQHWVQTLPEKVVHWGLLGFQHQQRLVVRLTILFKDRLDSWGSATKASLGFKEDSRILMSSIRGVETVSGGLILNLGGKKIGIHVGGNESLHQWSRALLSVLVPNKVDHNLSREMPSPQEQRARSETPRATPRKGRDWIPEVARKSTQSLQHGSGARGAQRHVSVVHRGVSLAMTLQKEQDLKRFAINTHKAAPEVLELLHGKQGKFLPHSHQPGVRHVHSDVAEKPHRSGSAISTRSTSREEGAHKVTGHERQIPSRGRVDHSFAFWKINTEEAVVSRSPRSQSQSDRSIGSRSRSRTPLDEKPITPKIGSDNFQGLRSRESGLSNGHGVCGKVGGAGRQPLQNLQRRAKNQGEPLGKVTDAGREQNGWASEKKAKSSFADKARELNKASMAQTASA